VTVEKKFCGRECVPSSCQSIFGIVTPPTYVGALGGGWGVGGVPGHYHYHPAWPGAIGSEEQPRAAAGSSMALWPTGTSISIECGAANYQCLLSPVSRLPYPVPWPTSTSHITHYDTLPANQTQSQEDAVPTVTLTCS